MSMTDPISPRQFQEADGLGDWRVVSDGGCAFYPTASLAESARLVEAIADIDGVESDPPRIDIRRDGVTIRLLTERHDHYGMTQRDIEIARAISDVAGQLGLSADPSGIQSFLIIPGAPNTAAVMPFWRAVLDYDERADSPEEDLVDPRDRGPAFWFEAMDEPRPGDGGAIHVAVWVPQEQAEARVAAALEAGGHVVRDDSAPAWWTLADEFGNEVDVATALPRE
jgi:4a-hydroxytetrahydrobiopterin dehydratase